MKTILTALTIALALAAAAEAQTVILVNPSSARLNEWQNAAAAARFRRQAREEVGTGVATPEQVARMNFVPTQPADESFPVAAPKVPEPAPEKVNPAVVALGREAGRISAQKAGHHAIRLGSSEVARRAKAAAPSKISKEDKAVFVREFVAGFAAANEAK